MRIAVVGTIVADTIEHGDGTVTESLGGIAHTVSALAMHSAGGHTIVPVCRVGADCRERIESWAAALDGVSLEGLLGVDDPQPKVLLSYGGTAPGGERRECLRDTVEPLSAADVDAVAGAAAVVVNCITGTDLTPPAMRRLRAMSPRIYLDIHSLALGIRADGARFYRHRDDWQEWLQSSDVVQCNLAEAATVCGLASNPVGEHRVIDALGDRLAAPGPDTWLLTLGAAGAVLLQRRAGGVTRTRLEAPAVCAVDPTGAGDAFGGGYVSAWLDGSAPRAAAAFALLSGSAACTRPGVPEPWAFRQAMEELRAGSSG